MSGLFAAGTRQEREKRAAHVFALSLVAGVAFLKFVTGVTLHGEPFTLYLLPVAAGAARGGFTPALVATFAAMLVGGLALPPAARTEARLLFAAEGMAIALVVAALRSRRHATEARLAAAEATVADLRLRDRHGRVLDAALRHHEEAAAETAVVVLNDRGMVTEWRPSAERLYGATAEHMVGASARSLFLEAPSQAQWAALLGQAARAGSYRQAAVHRRQDGTLVEVDLEIRPFGSLDARGFTLTAHDTARRREWDDYRREAASAQAALQHAADDVRERLAALENLTDPSLNPLGGPLMVTELLERLRTTIGADGAALVQPGRLGTGFVAARGLQPVAGHVRAEALRPVPGRVAFVHNDPVRVAQMCALRWPDGVSSLVVVPVVHDGQVRSTIELVSERSRQVSDWDVALARIVADRLAAVVIADRDRAARAS